MTCAQCTAGGSDVFVGSLVRRELRRYRKKGPTGTTRMLLHALMERMEEGATLLDIGAGVGVLHQELLAHGAASAVTVDASPEYVEAARAEALRRGTADRIEALEGDFVDLAEEVGTADVVTLDRVLCCYPHVRLLVGASAARTRHLYGVVFPREHALTRWGVRLVNLVQRLRGSAFRVYLHSGEVVEDELGRRGLRRSWECRTWLWRVRIYRRTGPEDEPS